MRVESEFVVLASRVAERPKPVGAETQPSRDLALRLPSRSTYVIDLNTFSNRVS
jgi:hypothetical protein